jgi:CheY-like chemotaxis protein
MSLEELLESWGMDVTVVLSVEMLKETIVDEGAFDLVIADYHLSIPEETGLDVLSAARQMPGMDKAVCMLLTGDTSTELGTQAHSMNVVVWYKPVRPARLRAYLNTLWHDSPNAATSTAE